MMDLDRWLYLEPTYSCVQFWQNSIFSITSLFQTIIWALLIIVHTTIKATFDIVSISLLLTRTKMS